MLTTAWAALMHTLLATTSVAADEPPTSAWARPGADGRLVYKTTAAGDRIMDFSAAGYRGGGVPLPHVPVKATVRPSGQGDDTATIQAAVDSVSGLPPEDGLRGAVLLGPGTFVCSQTIHLHTGGVVLRGSGSGSGPGGTTIRMVGARHRAIVVGSPDGHHDDQSSDIESAEARIAPSRKIVDAYVPAGSAAITLDDVHGLSIGDCVEIRRPVTAAWVRQIEMDTLRRDGRPQRWIGANRSGVTVRTITRIVRNTLSLDIPLSDSYDAAVLDPPGTTVRKVLAGAEVEHVGIEHLRLQCPPLEAAYGEAPYSGVRVGGDDCWIRDVVCAETMNTIVLAGRRITVQEVVITHTYPNLGASKPADFSLEGSQILLDRCRSTGGNTYFVWTTSLNPGPNVVLNCTFSGHGSRLQPHMRWSTGLLIDSTKIPDGGIDFMNRGVAGSGHGWTIGWAVAWNCVARSYIIQNPPGAANWAIGCRGERRRTARLFDSGPILPEGIFDSHGTPVHPRSLYLAQLAERTGEKGLRAIGYVSVNDGALIENTIESAPALPTEDDQILGPDLALHRPVNTGNVRPRTRAVAGERAVDADPETYWELNDGDRPSVIVIDMEGPVEVNALLIEEAGGPGQRVRRYRAEGQVDSDWRLLAEGTTITGLQVDRFPATTVWKVRITIEGEPYTRIRKIGLYRENRPEL